MAITYLVNEAAERARKAAEPRTARRKAIADRLDALTPAALRTLAVNAGLTQQLAADALGVSRSTYCAYVAGQARIPRGLAALALLLFDERHARATIEFDLQDMREAAE